MKTYETSATVEDRGEIRVAGVPFAPGTQVEVSISADEGPSSKKAPYSKQAAHDELDEMHRQYGNAEGAEAVEAQTVELAHRFIEALPPVCPMPSVGAEPDGHVTLEWYRATNWLLSVSVSPEGMLYWAALLGDEDPRGSCRFDCEIPQTILYWIRRVCPT